MLASCSDLIQLHLQFDKGNFARILLEELSEIELRLTLSLCINCFIEYSLQPFDENYSAKRLIRVIRVY